MGDSGLPLACGLWPVQWPTLACGLPLACGLCNGLSCGLWPTLACAMAYDRIDLSLGLAYTCEKKKELSDLDSNHEVVFSVMKNTAYAIAVLVLVAPFVYALIALVIRFA